METKAINTKLKGHARVDVADVLRGLAVMGIIILHSIEHFNFYSFPDTAGQSAWLNFSDKAIWNGLFFMFGGKAYAIFALLFGFSFFIQDDNQRLLSFLVATAAAQTVNFFVQKNLVFKSNAAFEKAVPKYIVLAVVLVLVSAALPAYSQSFFVNIGISEALAPTLANVLNILVQVVLSYPTMKFWIMPNK